MRARARGADATRLARASRRGGWLRRVLREAVDGAADRFQAALQIEDAQHGLKRRRQDGFACTAARLVLAAAEPHQPAQRQRRRPTREVRAGNDRGPRGRQHAHRRVRRAREQALGDDEAERGVTDEGEAVLRDLWRVLVAVRGVREGPVEQAEIDEAMAERRFEGGHIEGRHGSAGAPRAWGVWGAMSAPPCAGARSRRATAPPGRDERWGVWGAMSGPPISSGPVLAEGQRRVGAAEAEGVRQRRLDVLLARL